MFVKANLSSCFFVVDILEMSEITSDALLKMTSICVSTIIFFASIQNSVVLKAKETTMLKSSNFSSVTVRTEAKVQYLTFCNCLWPEKPYSCFWFIQRTYSPLAQWSVPFALLEFTHHISSFYEWNLTLIPKLQPVGPNFSQNYYYSWQH